MVSKEKAPVIDNPELLDAVFGDLQKGLVAKLGWLDRAFGRAERLVKATPLVKRLYTPNVYAGGNEYLEVSPDSRIGNFSFFWVDDPQNVDWEPNVSIGLTVKFSIIFWFDFRRITNSRTGRNKEQLKKEILDVLNGGVWLRRGRIRINAIYEKAENIYKGFSLDEIDNQFLMHPYGGFRFEGELSVTESCNI